jgi:hypothetical protein
MTDNIVDWLRDLGDRAASTLTAYHKAADKIERLQTALEEIEWSNDSKWQSDRARAALGEKTDV